MALGSSQPLTERLPAISPRVGKGGRCGGLTDLPLPCADCLHILGASDSWRSRGLSRPAVG